MSGQHFKACTEEIVTLSECNQSSRQTSQLILPSIESHSKLGSENMCCVAWVLFNTLIQFSYRAAPFCVWKWVQRGCNCFETTSLTKPWVTLFPWVKKFTRVRNVVSHCSEKKHFELIMTEILPFYFLQNCIFQFFGLYMKADFTWPTPLVSTVTYDRQVWSPSSDVLWKFLSAFILRPPRSSLDVHQQPDRPTHCSAIISPPCLPACPARERKKTLCMSTEKALTSPSFFIVCTPTSTSMHKKASAHTQKHVRWTGENLSRPTGTSVWLYSGWCFVLTFSDNGWEIMEKADTQAANMAAEAWCLSWPEMKRTAFTLWG